MRIQVGPLFLVLVAGMLMIPTDCLSQEMTVSQRRERCRNNSARLGELEQNAAELRKHIPWPEEKIARDAAQMDAIARRLESNKPFTLEELKAMYQLWDFDIEVPISQLKGKYTISMYGAKLADELYREAYALWLRDKLNDARNHNISLAGDPRTDFTRATLADIEDQIRFHKTNMAAYGCKDFSAEELKDPKTTGYKWVAAGTGDYAGSDVGSSEGVDPVDSMAKEGLTAVCWDDKAYKNGGRVWCTYKNVAPERFYQGPRTGYLYRSVPK